MRPAGFTQSDHPEARHADKLMVACPLPHPRDWDQTMQARMSLLHGNGLRPQLFLPASALESRPTRSANDRCFRSSIMLLS